MGGEGHATALPAKEFGPKKRLDLLEHHARCRWGHGQVFCRGGQRAQRRQQAQKAQLFDTQLIQTWWVHLAVFIIQFFLMIVQEYL